MRHHSRAAILLLWAKLFEIEFILVREDVIRPSRTSCRVIKFGSNRLLATGRNLEQDLIYLHRLSSFIYVNASSVRRVLVPGERHLPNDWEQFRFMLEQLI